jgi:AraC-like DNA-binding protein
MERAISESVPLPPGCVARVVNVLQDSATPVPARFPHFHGPAELVLIKAGHGEFISETSTVRFAPGSLLLIPAMVVHDFAFADGKRAWSLVQFDPYAIQSEAGGMPDVPIHTLLDLDLYRRMEMLIDWLDQSIADSVEQKAIALQLRSLILAVRQAEGEPEHSPSTTQSPLSRYRPFLNRLYHEPGKIMQLSHAASLCGMSTPYFSRSFKSVFGTGFIAYQTRPR